MLCGDAGFGSGSVRVCQIRRDVAAVGLRGADELADVLRNGLAYGLWAFFVF